MSIAAFERGGSRTRALPSLASVKAVNPLVWAVLVSRLLAYAGGAAGALLGGRVGGWTAADPLHVSSSFGGLGNVLLAPVFRWDGVGYLTIAEKGYAHARETILFPGYPLAVSALGWCIRSDVVAAVVVSFVSFAIAMWLLHRLTRLELGARAADATVLVLAFAPVSFFFTAAYSESLFLALSVGAVYAARRERWAIATLLGAAASVTRVTGILLVVPLALMAVRPPSGVRRLPPWLLAAPAALLAFLAYMSAEGYGWLAPLQNQHAHRFAGPWSTVASAASAAWHGIEALAGGTRPVAPSLAGALSPGFDSLVLLGVLALAVTALIVSFRRLPTAYGAYAALALLVCIASQTRIQPLEGLDRYTLTIFPLWMAAGAWLAERRAVRPIVLIGAGLLAFYSFEFATWAFVA